MADHDLRERASDAALDALDECGVHMVGVATPVADAVLAVIEPEIRRREAQALRDFADQSVHRQTAGRIVEDLHDAADELDPPAPATPE